MTEQTPKSTTALSLERTKFGWSVVEYTIDGDKVTKVVRTTPELRLIAIEKLRRKVNDLIKG